MSQFSASDKPPRSLFTLAVWRSVWRCLGRWRFLILLASVDLFFVGAAFGYWGMLRVVGGGRWFELREFGGFSFGVAHPVIVALATSQTALLAIWAVFGRGRWVLRWLAAVSGTCFWIAALGVTSTRTYKPALIEVLLLAQWLVIILFAAVIRLSGCRLVDGAQSVLGDARRRKTQFRLIDLFWCTAAVALLVATAPSLRLLQTYDELQRGLFGPATDYGVRLGRGIFVALATYGAVCGVAAVLALWATWAKHRSRFRLLATAALIWIIGRIAVGLVAIYKIHKLNDVSAYVIQPHAYLLWFGVHGGILLAALILMRPRGWFLGRPAMNETKQGDESETTDQYSPRKLRLAAPLVLILPLVATGWFFDDLTGVIFGDGKYRRAIGAIAARHGPAAVMPFGDFVGVWPRRPLTADDFEYYQRYAEIGAFNFDEGPTDEATWQSLKRWPRLRLLGLGRGVTDDDLKHVAGMLNLEHIWLHSPDVTDSGLAYFERLPNLQVLQTENSPKITDEGVKRLRKALPRTLIPRRP